MIDVNILPVFLIASFFLVISPGPDLLLVSTYSSARGMKAGILVSLGIFLSGLFQTTLVAFGLGKLMQELPPLVILIKVVGALYLSWLGLKLIKAWFYSQNIGSVDIEISQRTTKDVVAQGLLNNLLNPKALIFFSLFLPQFTHHESSLIGQIMTLGVLLSYLP
ncbi:LysE family translocator [Veronia nyctiphanis]|uniref:LysE family translocator n=1 Tax=Veronia nyctiphanis TaxID=1278244 RepID=UPI001F4794BF|nr:LysE family translocator [Veronia nyctiphanis]